MEQVLVTGGLGFIGLNLISKLTSEGQYFVHNIDNFSLGHTYFDSFLPKDQKDRVKNYRADINERNVVKKILNEHDIRKVFHLAAESHVDRSITGPTAFFQSNVMGTLTLVECCHEYIDTNKIDDFRFLHVSTDEVFGDLGPDDKPFNENTPYNPSSPYSASKASSDFILKSWARTYGFPVIITNCSNNFGPCQNEEKFIPTILRSLLSEQKIPVYGRGENVRDWLYVDHHVNVLIELIQNLSTPFGQFCVGGGVEISNLELIKHVWNLVSEREITKSLTWEATIEFVADRKGHDFRYAINDQKLRETLLDLQQPDFLTSLRQTVDFYIDNQKED